MAGTECVTSSLKQAPAVACETLASEAFYKRPNDPINVGILQTLVLESAFSWAFRRITMFMWPFGVLF